MLYGMGIAITFNVVLEMYVFQNLNEVREQTDK